MFTRRRFGTAKTDALRVEIALSDEVSEEGVKRQGAVGGFGAGRDGAAW